MYQWVGKEGADTMKGAKYFLYMGRAPQPRRGTNNTGEGQQIFNTWEALRERHRGRATDFQYMARDPQPIEEGRRGTTF